MLKGMAAKPQIAVNRLHRRRSATLALLAILLQAFLYGWHSHALQFGGNGRPPAVFAATGIELPAADDEDGCEVCSALHHQTASGAQFAAALPTLDAAAPASDRATALRVRRALLPFHARAPPLA
jgi:hypothetical protein